ncbi:MAG: response regulator [Proteobacteria bacterium]|nr:response regulator [Ramlibacter sp.]MCA0212424.1 response regulator [Pseudomonadota bacterium]
MTPEPRRILVVEDDARIADMLDNYLQAQGWRTTVLGNGLQVAPEVRRMEPALVLLDIMLPGQDGVEVCREVRTFSAVPIIMVTARVDEIDRLIGLEVGADDYVCKPFSPREVVARIKALLRRAEGRLGAGAPPHGFRVDDNALRIAWQEHWLPLTPLEFRLFKRLLSRPGHVFSRNALLESVHEDFRDTTDRAIDSHIKNLRRKIGKLRPQGSAIVSVYGMGYRFDPDTEESVS